VPDAMRRADGGLLPRGHGEGDTPSGDHAGVHGYGK
jgi:hypothetical protein